MSEEPQEVHEAILGLKPKYLRLGKHSTFLPIPDSLLTQVGHVIVQWGNFENSFNFVLDELIEKADHNNPVQRMAYKRRQKLLKVLAKEVLGDADKQTSDALIDLSGRSLAFHRKRNIIAHGSYRFTMLPYSNTATDFKAFVENEEISISIESLRQLWHDISHLNGDLVQLIKRICTLDGFDYTLPDTDLLRIIEDQSHLNLPISTT
jgi:hypothetical protein